MIVVFPSSCATVGDRRSVEPEKKQKVSNCLLFLSILNFLLSFFYHTLFFFSWYSFPTSVLPVGSTDAGEARRGDW